MFYYKDLLDDIIKEDYLCEDIIKEGDIYSIFEVSSFEVIWSQSDLLLYLLIVLRIMGFSNDECKEWFHDVKIPYYENKTPLEIIQNNEGEKLIDDLVSLQLGHTGG